MVEELLKRKDGKTKLIRTRILIAGKEVKLKFTMPIWLRMEDEICLLDDVYTMMHSKGRFAPDKIPALAELMSGGEILAEDDPATYRAMLDEIQAVIAKAMTMKEKKYDDDSVHDEVLEEIEKKEPKAD